MKNILDYLEVSASANADKIVFSDINKQLTYAQFVAECKKLATKIIGLGYKNQPIAIFDNRDVNTLVAMYGILYSGNYYVDIDSHSPADRINKILGVLSPKCFVCEDENTQLIKELGVTSTINIKEIGNVKIDENALAKIRSNSISTDPAYVLFTSGSTGTPKGTVCSHQNIISYINWFVKAFDYNNTTISANQMSFYFSGSVPDVFATTFAGATLHIVPKSYFAFPIQLVNFLNEKKVNSIYWVPSALCIIANMKLFDYALPQYIKKVLFVGEVMPNKQLNYWRKNLPDVMYANLYGPTETTDVCTYYIVNRKFEDDQTLPIGKHCDNCHTFIVDENGKEVTEVGKIGELYARGAFVAYGYFDNSEKTKEAFVQNPLQNHYPEIVYRTGDLVKLNEYGEYEFAGRRDFQIKHMGYRIELGEIETNVGAIKGVNACVCIYDAEKDFIVLVYQGKVKKEELLEIVKQKVPEYMVPNITIKVAQMPYNQNGKIDRNFLKNNYKTLMDK